MRSILTALMTLSLLAGVAGCSRPADTGPDDTGTAMPESPASVPATKPAIATLAGSQSDAFCRDARALQQSVTAFLDQPATNTLAAAREQWRQTHKQYALLQASYQLAGMPLPQVHDDRDPIDAHPMLSGYLDQVAGYPQSGLVYSEVPMTPQFLRGEHQSTDFYYLTLGLHPLEVMLWNSRGQTDAERVALFIPPAQPAADQVNARARRVDLLRLIAHALPRDAADLCAPDRMQALSAALTKLSGDPEALRQALSRTLDDLVKRPLATWKAQPEGEDRNGMPIWHSPLAHTDFEEMKARLNSLNHDWLPVLAPSPEPPWLKALGPALEQLADQLPSLGNSKKQRAPEVITDLQKQLASIQTRLLQQDKGQAATPSAKEAGQ